MAISDLDALAVSVTFNAVVALCTVAVGLAILAANPRRNWNQWLAFFLLLVGGNFAAQALIQALSLARLLDLAPPTSAATSALAQRVGTILLLFDPPVLVYFASLFPRRTTLAEKPWGVPLLAAPLLVFVAAEVGWGHMSADSVSGEADPLRIAFLAYLAACYLYASWRVLANYLSEPSSVMAAQARVVAAGLMVAALPRVALVFTDPPLRAVLDLQRAVPPDAAEFVLRLGLLAAVFGVTLWWVRRQGGREDRREDTGRLLRLVGFAFLAFAFLWGLTHGPLVLEANGQEVPEGLTDIGHLLDNGLVFTVRWFAFSAAIVVGVLRYQVLAVASLRLAVLAAATLLGAGAVGLGAALGGPVLAATFAAVALAAVALGMVRVGGTGRRDRSSEYVHQRGLEVYRAQLAAGLAAGVLESGELGALRARLGVSQREHEALLAIAQAENAGVSSEGMIGRYAILRRLGVGGYATVYLAREGHGRLVVLKRLHEDMGGAAALDTALRELEVARRVSHPHLIAIHDMVRLDDGAVVVMDLAEGGSLRDLMQREGRLGPARTAALLRQALAGLGALHEAGIVHGDLKPENVLLTASGDVKLADFGTAHAIATHNTLVSGGRAGAGTLPYMAPEQVRGEPATPRSDLYALAAIAHEGLTGKPYVASQGGALAVMGRVLKGEGDRSATPPRWSQFLARGLAVDAARRHRSAAEMQAALEGATGEAAEGLPPLGPRRPRA